MIINFIETNKIDKFVVMGNIDWIIFSVYGKEKIKKRQATRNGWYDSLRIYEKKL